MSDPGEKITGTGKGAFFTSYKRPGGSHLDLPAELLRKIDHVSVEQQRSVGIKMIEVDYWDIPINDDGTLGEPKRKTPPTN